MLNARFYGFWGFLAEANIRLAIPHAKYGSQGEPIFECMISWSCSKSAGTADREFFGLNVVVTRNELRLIGA
jgi:hypothetical protein